MGITCLFIRPSIAFSDEPAQNSIKDFSYEVVFPENQHDKNVGYYDLLMKPGEKQTIQLKMHNVSDKPLKVAIDLNSAKTNGNGVIEYGPTDLKKDVSLNYDLAQIVTGPQEVTLKPNSTETIDFVITLPEAAFEGYLAGGIQLKPIVKEEYSQEKSIIINKFAFLIGVLIHESSTEKIKPSLKLNDVSLKLKNGSYSLFVDLSNTKGVFVEKMDAVINIRKNKSSKNLIEFRKQDMRMAPHSNIAMPVSLQNQKITAGEYTADIRITTADGGNWTWVKNFTFTKIEAEKVNQYMNQNAQSNFSGWWLLSFSTVLLITIVLFFLLKKKRLRIK
ncbi:DUF916 and DUF3324 domain-containing protein [Enterococcus rotai]|uniref:DUF916 and DUF3324 domain-containing protein n=1 Tax=Enterococcus rotai TaxID=118060 RepID=UPI0032B3BCD3